MKVIKIIGIVIGVLVVIFITVPIIATSGAILTPPEPTKTVQPVDTPTVTLTPEEQAANDKADKAQQEEDKVAADKANYTAWVDGQFSLMDGSQIQLVKQVKSELNDVKSFKHLKTTYTDYKTYLIVFMEFTAKNQYNATIQETVKAKSDYKTNTVTILPQ